VIVSAVFSLPGFFPHSRLYSPPVEKASLSSKHLSYEMVLETQHLPSFSPKIFIPKLALNFRYQYGIFDSSLLPFDLIFSPTLQSAFFLPKVAFFCRKSEMESVFPLVPPFLLGGKLGFGAYETLPPPPLNLSPAFDLIQMKIFFLSGKYFLDFRILGLSFFPW